MVTRSCVVTAAVALLVASAAIGCGALIGIEDGVADPGTDAADASTILDSAHLDTGAADADASAAADTSTTPDSAPTPGPIGAPGGTTTMLPCGGASCAIPGESCCAYRSSTQAGVYTGVCAVTCTPPGPGTDRVAVLKCSENANCPAATPRCCLPLAGAAATTCRTSCNFQSEVQLCDPSSMTNTCGGGSCRRFSGMTMPPSWGYCQ